MKEPLPASRPAGKQLNSPVGVAFISNWHQNKLGGAPEFEVSRTLFNVNMHRFLLPTTNPVQRLPLVGSQMDSQTAGLFRRVCLCATIPVNPPQHISSQSKHQQAPLTCFCSPGLKLYRATRYGGLIWLLSLCFTSQKCAFLTRWDDFLEASTHTHTHAGSSTSAASADPQVRASEQGRRQPGAPGSFFV